MYKLTLIIFLNIFNNFSFGNELLIAHDQMVFNPLDKANKEIAFIVEVPGLAEEITKLKSYGKVKNIKFDVKVNKLRRVDIKINGVSEKFNDLNNNLKAKLGPMIELLFPTSLNNFYRGYKQKNKNNKVVATDTSYQKPIRESYMTFDRSGILSENKIKTPQGTQIVNFSYKNRSSGFKKVLLTKVSRKIIYGPSHLLSNTVISYDEAGEKPIPKEFSTEFIFENKENNTNSNRVNKLLEVFKISNFKYN